MGMMRGVGRARIELCSALTCIALASLLACASVPLRGAFRIQVIDQATGRGVPAVELRTVDQRSFFTDSAGVIAVLEPDLMRRSVFFEVRAFGYRFAERHIGVTGTTLELEPGGRARLFLFRENIAQRYYRITGADIYRDSRLLGEPTPLDDPLETSDARDIDPLLGVDSAFAKVYRGRLFWVWGDAKTAANPLASLRATGATSELPERAGLDPARGIALDYFRDADALRPLVDSDHPVVWLSALRVAKDAQGNERLFATYAKIGEGMQAIEQGLAELDDASGRFELIEAYPKDAPIIPDGHVLEHASAAGEHFYYDLAVRSPTDAASVRSLDRYEAFTALRTGRRIGDPDALERDATGELVWNWKSNAAPIREDQWRDWVEAGVVEDDEAWYRLIDVASGETIVPHRGSVQWNAHRRRWILLRTQLGGDSLLGEVFYAEADAPLGPWAYAQKVLTHAMPPSALESGPGQAAGGSSKPETLSFYNPVHHPELDRNAGRQIFFEGTLSTAFATNARPIPSYDYNQIMYALDLEDPRLRLPVAIYRVRTADGAWRYGTAFELADAEATRELVFFAPDRPRAGSVSVREVTRDTGLRLVPDAGATDTGADHPIRFYCTHDAQAPATTPLYELRDPISGAWVYTTTRPAADGAPICRVWSLPVRFPRAVARTAFP